LKAADLQGREVRCVIESVALEEMPDGEEKPVVRFVGKSAGLALNRTNSNTLAEVLGDETDGWRGAAVVLVPETTDLRGRRVHCIRLRVEGVAKPATAYAPPPLAQPAIDDEIPF
jgi:hypothetical protein